MDDPKNVLEFKKSKKPKVWKVQYQVTRTRKSSELRVKAFFWLKFVAYLGLVFYALQQCGYLPG